MPKSQWEVVFVCWVAFASLRLLAWAVEAVHEERQQLGGFALGTTRFFELGTAPESTSFANSFAFAKNVVILEF